MAKYVQWTTPDNESFYPAGNVAKQLPPGYYALKSSMMGLYFERKEPKTEKLLRFPDSTTDAVIEEIESFWGKENKFRESEIPYKRGMCLYGPPGSGKTCTIRLVIENLTTQHDGIVIDFPDYVGLFKEGYEALRQIHENMPLVVLMEDLDAILRRSSESEIMNLLDGVFNIDRTIFLATTNYPEKLGSRILNRPSRFDKKIFVGMPSNEAREMYIRSKLIDESDETINRWVEDTNGMSIAHLKELFVANKILGDPYENAIKTLKSMKVTTGSSTFDDYTIENKKTRSTHSQFQAAKEAYWENWGRDGKVYAEAKKKAGKKTIMEDAAAAMPSRDQIANLITEDL
jgi:SpoVK/Ycf46/Vps4 family AAA+-type ATPase